MTENLGAVEALLKHDDPSIRRAAACVVGDWAGHASLPRMRQLLTDPDPGVRAMAVVTLAALDDRESSKAIRAAVRGIDDDAPEVISALAVWKNPLVVPAIIGYLQDDGPGSSNEDLHVRCLLARAALEQVTGHRFPLDVGESDRIWRQAEQIADAGRREAFLTQALPREPVPLVAEFVRDKSGLVVVVTNTSRRPVLLARTPQSIDVSFTIHFPDGGSHSESMGGGFEGIAEVTGKDSFVELAPGGSTRFPYLRDEGVEVAGIGSRFFQAGPGLREATLSYKRNGHEYGLKAWVGTLRAATGSLEVKK